MGKAKEFFGNKIVKRVLWNLFFVVVAVVVVLSITIKPKHVCVVGGERTAAEYEFQTGSKKLNGRTYKEFEKVHLCKEHLNAVKNGKIKLSYDNATKTYSYKNVE